MLRFAALLLVLDLMVPETSGAVSNPNAKILIHLAPPVSKTACTEAQASPACASIRTAGDLLPEVYFAYVLATDGVSCHGIAGMQFGINYNGAPNLGVDIYSWNACAPGSLPGAGWPGTGTGIQIAWDPAGACQTTEPGGVGTGVVATAGYFYLAAYSADALRVIQRPADGLARITDCGGNTTTIYGNGVFPNPSPLGYVALSAGAASPGYNPCGANVQPPSCQILGSSNVAVGTTSTYTVDAATCNGAAQWTIAGNGSIQGSTFGSQVSVHAGAAGSFTLTANGTDTGGPFTCSRTVQVIEPPLGCSITGPATVSPGITASYFALSISGASYAWTLTGNGSITGAADQRQVMVMAGDPGSFQLSVMITANGQSSSCGRTVTVAFGSCTLLGFDDVFPAPGVYTFIADLDSAAASFSWSISGNGTILGSTTGWLANVQAGPASGGPFTLMVQITKSGTIRVCSKTVNVLEPPPPPPGENRQAKIMLHVRQFVHGCHAVQCCTFGVTSPCSGLVTKGSLYPLIYYAALLVVNGETDGSPYSGISGVQLGIDYNAATGQGIDIWSWTRCGDLDFPSGGWPEAGGGNLIIFEAVNRCQKGEPGGAGTGVSAQFGYFYFGAYTPDRFSVTTNPSDGIAKVIDCAGRVTNIEGGGVHGTPSPLGFVSFSSGAVTPGYNPCNLVIPVENTTWSRVKGLFVEPTTKPE